MYVRLSVPPFLHVDRRHINLDIKDGVAVVRLNQADSKVRECLSHSIQY